MPYKSGKLKGELTTAEMRKLVKAHNILMSIKIPPNTDREGLITLVKKHGYSFNHEKQSLIPASSHRRKPKIEIAEARALTKPKPKTEEQKKKAEENKNKRDVKKKEQLKQAETTGIKKGAVIGKLVAKRQMRKGQPAQKPVVKKPVAKPKPASKLKDIKIAGGVKLKPYVKPAKKN
tara:strand:- start:16717 stop:17247 length:531 start_codon:yes stop_codon:yes gene_type:complete